MDQNQKWTLDSIRTLLLSNSSFLIRAAKKVYQYQTDFEKQNAETIKTNNVGFNKPDARILTSLIEFHNSRGYLTEKQLFIMKKKMTKYSGQIVRIINNQNKEFKYN